MVEIVVANRRLLRASRLIQIDFLGLPSAAEPIVGTRAFALLVHTINEIVLIATEDFAHDLLFVLVSYGCLKGILSCFSIVLLGSGWIRRAVRGASLSLSVASFEFVC